MGGTQSVFGCKNKEGTVFIYSGGDIATGTQTVCYYINKNNLNDLSKFESDEFNTCLGRYQVLFAEGWTDLTNEEHTSYVTLLRSALKGQNQPKSESATAA